MNEISYLIYLLVFVVGSVLGLLFSYKKHGEAYINNNIEITSLIIALVGWILIFNYGLFVFLPSIVTISTALLCISFVIGMRPGYGRKETLIAILMSVLVWILSNLIF